MRLSYSINLLMLTLAVACIGRCSTSSQLSKMNDEEAFEYLCASINKIDHISTMNRLINATRAVKAKSVENNIRYHKRCATFAWSDPVTWSWICGDRNKSCLVQADAILALEDIINEQKNVCSKSHIDKVAAYKKRYTKKGFKLTKSFFTLYANQLSVICKQHLLRSLKTADEQLISRESYEKVTLWLRPDKDCDKITEDADLEQDNLITAEREIRKTKAHCQAAKALTSMKNINDLVEAIGSEPDEMVKTESYGSKHKTSYNRFFVLLVADNMRTQIEDILNTCSKFEQVYQHTVMPIVRLAQMGYNPEYQNLDKRSQEEFLIQNWFSITLVCNSILSARLADSAYQKEFATLMAKNEHGIIIVDPVNDFGSNVDETGDYFKCPIDDELWIKAYLPGTLRRTTSLFVKNIMKSFKIDDLSQNVVFKRRISKGTNYMLKLIFISLAFAGLGSPIAS